MHGYFTGKLGGASVGFPLIFIALNAPTFRLLSFTISAGFELFIRRDDRRCYQPTRARCYDLTPSVGGLSNYAVFLARRPYIAVAERRHRTPMTFLP
jgi:hypothetical protein